MGAKRHNDALHGLPSLSLRQAARRWDCEEADIADYIKIGQLPAHILLQNQAATITVRGKNRKTTLTGHYRLPVESAIKLLGGAPAPLMFSLQVVAKEPDTIASFSVCDISPSFEGDPPRLGREDVRIRVEDLERFDNVEGSPNAPDPNTVALAKRVLESKRGTLGKWLLEEDLKQLTRDEFWGLALQVAAEALLERKAPTKTKRKSQIHKEQCRAFVEKYPLAERNNVQNMIDRMQKDAPDAAFHAYPRETLRRWIRDLCPGRRAGRPRKAKN